MGADTKSGTHSVASAERLVDAVCELATARSIDDIVDLVRHAARQLTGADGATFVLRDEGFCFYVDEDAISPLWRGQRFSMDTCISGWVMRNREPVVIEDIYADDRIPHDAYRPTFVQSLAMVPIRTSDPIGAIGNYWADSHVASAEELRLLQALADSTAVALENVRIVENLEELVDQRTQELTLAYAQLQQFAAGAAHDLRTPLHTVALASGILRRDFGDALGDTGAGHLATLESAIAAMDGLVSDLLTYAEVGSRPLSTEPVDVGELLEEITEWLGGGPSERANGVECGPLPTVVADRALLSQLLQNLLVNALTYAAGDGVPVARVSGRETASGWEVSVSDRGPGIPDDEKALVFEPFRRGAVGRESAPGTGLGLAICRRIAERHGGTLEVFDAPEGGAAFTLTLPPPDTSAA